jgi:hypothetical protein
MTDQRHCKDAKSDWQSPFLSSRTARPEIVIARRLPLICHREQLASNLSSRGACDVAIQQQSLRRGDPVFTSKNVKLLKFYFIYAIERNIKTNN